MALDALGGPGWGSVVIIVLILVAVALVYLIYRVQALRRLARGLKAQRQGGLFALDICKWMFTR
jgi:hypothetical protein